MAPTYDYECTSAMKERERDTLTNMRGRNNNEIGGASGAQSRIEAKGVTHMERMSFNVIFVTLNK